jgi:hypothetical protein
MRKFMYLRLAFLVPLLVAVFLFHVSGTALVAIRIARIVVVALVLLVASRFRARRSRED